MSDQAQRVRNQYELRGHDEEALNQRIEQLREALRLRQGNIVDIHWKQAPRGCAATVVFEVTTRRS